MNSSFVHRSLHLKLAATAVALLIAMPAFGDFIINDTFETDTLGQFPANWTITPQGGVGTNGATIGVVTGVSSPPPGSQAFKLDLPTSYPTNTEGWVINRPFTPFSLSTAHPTDLGFDFRLDRIDNPAFGFGVELLTPLPLGAAEPFVNNGGYIRVAGGPATYSIFTDASEGTTFASGLSTGAWYNMTFSIHFTNDTGNGGTGFTTWTLKDSLNNVVSTTDRAFTLPSGGYTNITSVQFTDFIPGAAGESLFLDNVQISMIPEPSTMLLLDPGVWLLWRARTGRKA
jgi:hypothetical protein